MTCHKFKLERKLTKEEAAVALAIGKELEDFIITSVDWDPGEWIRREYTAYDLFGPQRTAFRIADGEFSVWLFSEKEEISQT